MKSVSLINIFCFYYMTRCIADTPSIYNFIQTQIVFNSDGLQLQKDVHFHLFTRKNPDKFQELQVNDKKTLKASNYDKSLPTKFVTHGWSTNSSSMSCISVRDGFLSGDNYNVIVVDWGAISKKDYLTAASRALAIGGYVAQMIDFVVSEGNNLANITLVGHSLGAHVMGLAGLQSTNILPHIVGLDPAGPGFQLQASDGRIDRMDANLVEIIHSNAGVAGLAKSIGHRDYYPNGGGPHQPGCQLDTNISCPHARSYYFYSESLTNPDKWYGIRCDNYLQFRAGKCNGNLIVPFPRWSPIISKPYGVYMLETSDESPYGLGMSGTQPQSITPESVSESTAM